jgi:hypothetical protein
MTTTTPFESTELWAGAPLPRAPPPPNTQREAPDVPEYASREYVGYVVPPLNSLATAAAATVVNPQVAGGDTAPVGFVEVVRIETLEREVRALRYAAEVNEKAHQVTQIELNAVYRQYERLLDRLGNDGVDRNMGTAGVSS